MIRRPHLSPQLIIAAVFLVGSMGGLVLYVQQKKSVSSTSPLVPTKQLDASTGIGGQSQHQSPPLSPAAKTPSRSSTHSIDSPPSLPTEKAASSQAPKQDEIIATTTKEYRYTALAAPNDPYYATSWSMQHTNAQAAWNISTGTPVTVAVIDTGYALQHEDLSTQWTTNAGEQGMTKSGDRCWTGAPQDRAINACDDDNNGYVDDWRGWNFVSVNNLPQAGTTSAQGMAAISHGTAVAGLIAAATNNGKGVASYNWNAKIMPLQALDDSGSGVTSSIIAAITYAVDNGAQVINLSLGSPDKDPALQPAIDYAFSKNVVVVAAAGNCGTTGDAGCYGQPAPMMMYPALNNHVIAVGATDAYDKRASFSSFGPGIDVVAPGSGSITSPLIDTTTTPYNYVSSYAGSLYGTSFASPTVSGIIALVRSIRPSTSVDDITALIDANATKVSTMNGQVYTNEYGHGLVNASTAATIAHSLTNSTTSVPVLAQTGDYRSEHSYSTTATMSTGCTAPATTYCTVRMTNTSTGFDRYLPYAQLNQNGQVGWQWSGGILGSNEWSLRAMQGDSMSATPYLLFSK